MAGRNKNPSQTPPNITVLDVKPMRTLAPMFPAPQGFHTFTPPNAPSFVCVTPFGPPAADPANNPPGFTPGPVGPIPFPVVTGPHSLGKSPKSRGRPRIKSPSFQTPRAPPSNEEIPKKRGRGRPRKVDSVSSGGTGTRTGSRTGTSSSGRPKTKRKYRPQPKRTKLSDVPVLPLSDSHDPRESVEEVLMTFDALRRRLMQIDEANNIKNAHHLKAGSLMMENDLRINKGKRIGSLPGVEVGDMYYFRIEMCLVGVNSQTVAGIDYTTSQLGEQQDPIAVSIVSSGVYENTEDDIDTLVYTGQGMSGKDDQKLEKGNLALERSMHRGNEVRVVRSVRDYASLTGKIYVYDGLYKVRESWVEKTKTGFNVFKYKLHREPNQPDGIAVWKMTDKWRNDPSSRGKVILPDISSGVESKPVCLVNDVDEEKGPSHFTYFPKVEYKGGINPSARTQACACNSVCLPGDKNCSCAGNNENFLPYSAAGILVTHKPVIYECGDLCKCNINCRNRVTQKGVQLHFEVFKTGNRGWGLRCWEPIRVGTFICQFTGEIINKSDYVSLEEEQEEDYVFKGLNSDLTPRWNYGPELINEPSRDAGSKPLDFVISAKEKGNVARFMNHSCSPNVFWQIVMHDHGDDAYPHVMFFAMKHIPPMTELTYDYGISQNHGDDGEEEKKGSKKCLCGSAKCRGTFG